MFKVEKNSLQELVVNFKEFFVGATIEEATKKAHEQEKPQVFSPEKKNVKPEPEFRAPKKVVS